MVLLVVDRASDRAVVSHWAEATAGKISRRESQGLDLPAVHRTSPRVLMDRGSAPVHQAMQQVWLGLLRRHLGSAIAVTLLGTPLL
jgi:hypothetical protein